MWNEKPKCVTCNKEIEGEEVVFVKLRYPKYKGMTEIKAYLKNEGRFVCESCFENKTK